MGEGPVICHPAASAGHVGSLGGAASQRDVLGKYAKSQACRQQERAGKTHTHTFSAEQPPPSLFHTRTRSFSPFTPPPTPPSRSAIVDLWSSRRSMALRGDQARLHTSSVKRRSTRALKPRRTFCSATSRRPAETVPFSADRDTRYSEGCAFSRPVIFS